MTQAVLYLYLPAWLDLKASGEQQKTVMLSVLLYSGALGVLIGYIVTAQMVLNAIWQWAFYIEVFVAIVLFFVISCIGANELDLKVCEQPKPIEVSTPIT